MQKLFLFLKGYIYICVTGFAPERFVNLCGNRGIFLWGINKKENSYFMYMKRVDFFKIAPLVRKTKTKVVLLKKIGLPFLVPEIYKKKMFMLGFMMTFWLWHLSSFFVWKIDLQGNIKITDEDILRTLSQVGVTVGGRVDRIDYEQLEKHLREIYPDIIWISVKQRGTIVEIAVRENDSLYTPQKEETPACDLVATKDGVLRHLIVRKGVPKASIGKQVKKGDILISGTIVILGDDGMPKSKNYVTSDADIMIETQIPVHITLPQIYYERKYTGRVQTGYTMIGLKGKTLAMERNTKYLHFDEVTETLRPVDFLLWTIPFTINQNKCREYYVIEYENDLSQASEKLEEEFADFLVNLMEKGVQIISKNVKIEKEYTNWALTGFVTVLSPAFEARQIEDNYE